MSQVGAQIARKPGFSIKWYSRFDAKLQGPQKHVRNELVPAIYESGFFSANSGDVERLGTKSPCGMRHFQPSVFRARAGGTAAPDACRVATCVLGPSSFYAQLSPAVGFAYSHCNFLPLRACYAWPTEPSLQAGAYDCYTSSLKLEIMSYLFSTSLSPHACSISAHHLCRYLSS